jgi:hypothetical protein
MTPNIFDFNQESADDPIDSVAPVGIWSNEHQ